MDGRVRVDMEPIEAPYEYENTQITRVGDMLKVTHARGFSLECDLLNQMCIFRMSGWYHGKVRIYVFSFMLKVIQIGIIVIYYHVSYL